MALLVFFIPCVGLSGGIHPGQGGRVQVSCSALAPFAGEDGGWRRMLCWGLFLLAKRRYLMCISNLDKLGPPGRGFRRSNW